MVWSALLKGTSVINWCGLLSLKQPTEDNIIVFSRGAAEGWVYFATRPDHTGSSQRQHFPKKDFYTYKCTSKFTSLFWKTSLIAELNLMYWNQYIETTPPPPPPPPSPNHIIIFFFFFFFFYL